MGGDMNSNGTASSQVESLSWSGGDGNEQSPAGISLDKRETSVRTVQVDGEHDEDDTDDSDYEGIKKWMINEPARPKQITVKRVADMAAFSRYIERKQSRQPTDPEKKTVIPDHLKSSAWLMQDLEAKKIIASPRDYQLELFERAKQENTIAVLDTGSGKTLIAALLTRWAIEKELESRATGKPRRVAFFLVDKVALVFQQFAVLSCNLNYPMDRFCGDMVQNMTREDWLKKLDDNMAIVCTADILRQCLHRSYVKMQDINLIVFDEAHHTKKNHPYAGIIKDFYVEAKEDDRPRILGMTASPVDSKDDPMRAAEQLEALLHSRIATAADPSTLRQTICRPKAEREEVYDKLQAPSMTALCKSLDELLSDHDYFEKPFKFAEYATSHLGRWVADRFWQLRLKEADLERLQDQAEKSLQGYCASHEQIDKHIKQVQDAVQLVKKHSFPDVQVDAEHLSSKVIKLYHILEEAFADEKKERRCMVFVDQRNTASILYDLFKQAAMAIPGLKTGVLMGNGSNDSVGYSSGENTYRDQLLTIHKFKRGELNCIFATSVAEEGLDIPDCNFIIRFDLYQTLIQYIQSRGRARSEESVYVHMLERGNLRHRQTVDECRTQETALRSFCQALPEDRKLSGNSYDMEYFLRSQRDQSQFTVPATGAKLNYKQAIGYINSFVTSLECPPNMVLAAEYAIATAPGGFQCEIMMPEQSPIRSAEGKVRRSKALAKCAAAYEMCLLLWKAKYLDDHLRPVFTKKLPAMRNARLALSSKKKGEYKRRIKPDMWTQVGEPTHFYALALTLTRPEALGRDSKPLLLLTRTPLVEIPPFSLFFGQNRSSEVRCIPVPGALECNNSGLARAATAFTLRIFKDVFSKEYEASPAEMPYYLGPTIMHHTFDFAQAQDAHSVMDWQTLEFVEANQEKKVDFSAPDDFFRAGFITDPFDGSRKYFLRRRRHDMKPTDKVPEGVVAPRHRSWRTCATKNIMDYSNSKWAASRDWCAIDENQAVVEAELMPLRRNLLDDDEEEDVAQPRQCFLVLQPLRVSALAVQDAAMAFTIPAIMHRIESFLIAQDACKLLGLDIRPKLALEALTKDSDNPDEHNADQINFQAGMGSNYERLEFLGDCFLKMATSIAIFTRIQDQDEFAYHVHRMLMICNTNLFNNALEINLQEYIRSMSFDRRSWYPDKLKLVRGKRTESKQKHSLAYKSIADVCEAFIGAAYLTAREEGNMDMAVQAVTTMVKDKIHTYARWSEYNERYVKPDWQTTPATAVDTDMAVRFAASMGYSFRYPRLLRCAFMHPSSSPGLYYKLPNYQRLEFLGDSLFDMVCVDYLFHAYPGADPQWLTEHKMACVSNQFLGSLAVYLGFHRSLRTGNSTMMSVVGDYAMAHEASLEEARRAAVEGGLSRDDFARHFWTEDPLLRSPPKCLADVVEAYMGALFVDAGCDLAPVRDFFDSHVLPWFRDMSAYDTYASKHPVTFMASLLEEKLRCSDWRVVLQKVPMTTATSPGEKDSTAADDDDDGGESSGRAPGLDEHGPLGGYLVWCGIMVHGRVLGNKVSDAVGQAASGNYAKLAAAKKALRILADMTPADFRLKHGCTCPAPAVEPVGMDVDVEVDTVMAD